MFKINFQPSVNSEEWFSLNSFDGEMWKPIKGYEGFYSISNYGRVRSEERYINRRDHKVKIKASILKASLAKNGYYIVNLVNHGSKSFYIHRLVSEYYIPNPLNLPCIDHINTDRLDNRTENLRWVSYVENNNNPITRKNMSKGKQGYTFPVIALVKSREATIKPVVQKLNGEVVKVWDSVADAARELNITPQNIYRLLNHKGGRTHAGGFQWERINK